MRKRQCLLLALVLLLLTACEASKPQPTQTTTNPGAQSTAPTTVTTAPPTTLPPSGWQQIDGKTVYLDAGIRRTGWQEIDDSRYFFDQEGFMHTGWLEQEAGKFYLGADGKMQTGWVTVEQQTFYLNPTVQTGFLELEDGTYYLDENGNPVTGSFTLNGENYRYNQDGKAYTGFLELDGDTYYYLPNGMMAKGEVLVDGRSWFFTSQGKHVLIVNFRSPIAEDYAPALVSWRKITLETHTMDALRSMLRDGEALGYTFSLNSAYRTYADQQRIWDKYYNQYLAEGLTPEQAREKVAMRVATPGYSEHHTGLAVDIDSTWAGLDWLAENSWRYGLIVRFPEDKTAFTGVMFEPWHFRYVGEELAKELYESGQCMEEYMQNLTAQQGRTV